MFFDRVKTAIAPLRTAKVRAAVLSWSAIAVSLSTVSLSAVSLSACGAPNVEPLAIGTIAVQPRVVVDGTMELATDDSHGWHVVIDEVLFHAPSVVQHVGIDDDVVAELVAGAEDPLLFRYNPRSTDGFGDVVGGERSWLLERTGQLDFAFAPFAAAPLTLAKLESGSGVDLDVLAGHTAVVRGTLIATSSISSQSARRGMAVSPCEGDPDGNPADCASDADGTEAEGDPDGNPAEPTPEGGTEAEGDPDGNPAEPAPESGTEAEGDPDGNPAKPGGALPGDEVAEGDPDGNPAKPGSRTALSAARNPAPVGTTPLLARGRVPFVVVLNKTFGLRIPVDELFAQPLADDEVMPIDLHVHIDELFSDELMAALDAKSLDAGLDHILVEAPTSTAVSSMRIDVKTDGVRKAKRQVATTGGIRVTGATR